MYIKWSLKLDRQVPSYILLDETKRDQLKVESRKRAIKFKNRV